MSDSTRRGFLKTSGVVAAGVTVGAAAAGAATAQAADAAPAPALPASARGALVAYVTDVQRGEIAFLTDGREVTVTDHDLVARLATALHDAHRAG